jgi:hypothetical protein
LRIVDLERLPDQVVDEVDLRPGHVIDRHRVDQHHGALARQHQVILGLGALDVELVLEARAAAAFDETRSIAPAGSFFRISPMRRAALSEMVTLSMT